MNKKDRRIQEKANKKNGDIHYFANLGIQLAQLGNIKKAIRAFENALKVDPKFYPAHYNIGILYQGDDKFNEAVVAYKHVLKIKPDYAEAHNNLGITFKELGRLDEAEASYRQAIALKPALVEAHSNLGVTLKELGRLDEAEACLTQAIALKPDLAEAHSNLGNTLQELGRLDEAEASLIKAIAFKPDYAEAHYNLGVTLHELSKLEEAEASYTQVIALKPDYARAHNNLGNTLKDLGRLEESEASLVKAIALRPDYAEAHYNLGVTLQELGKLDEAISAYFKAITLRPNFGEATESFGIAIQNFRFKSSYPNLYPILINFLTSENSIRPQDIAGSILSLLRHDPLIKDLLSEKIFINDLRMSDSVIESLNKLPLLNHLMRICPIPDLQLEELFVTIRGFILSNLYEIEASPELIYFISTLSLQCFTNEYIYYESVEETRLIRKLEISVTRTIAKSEQPQLIELLCLATYRPLHNYVWCDKQVVLDQVEEIKARLIEEPLSERVLKKNLPVLGVISDDVSLKVRKQYEKNPYPRWVKLAIPLKSESIIKFFDKNQLKIHSKKIEDVFAPKILIAGCGTGQHSIEAASHFSNCQVLAVDLSLTSLAYAKRKTIELDISNLEHLQADILDLHRLDRKFDLIESAGVLHHMDDPMAGWKVLTDLLKPGSLIKIGLYSELARNHIAKIREEIVSLELETTEAGIRKFRQMISSSQNTNDQKIIESSDFYSLSTLRDLIFHEQEHRFTIPQLVNCIDELGLKFCGFENMDIISEFRQFHEVNSDIYDLSLWHQFEKNNPGTFAGMYQFWCQKF